MRLKLLMTIFVFGVLTACAVKDSEPVKVVKKIYLAKKNANSEALKLMKLGKDETEEAGQSEMNNIWNEITHQGTTVRVQVLKQSIMEKSAQVHIKAFFKDKSNEENDVSLTNIDNQWLMLID